MNSRVLSLLETIISSSNDLARKVAHPVKSVHLKFERSIELFPLNKKIVLSFSRMQIHHFFQIQF